MRVTVLASVIVVLQKILFEKKKHIQLLLSSLAEKIAV